MALNTERARYNMIEQQIRPGEVLDSQVLKVLAEVPREEFVPTRHRKLAFADLRLPLGHGQVMMRPMEEGRVLQSLALHRTDRVLEVGTGSGFLAACLGRLCAEVLSLEYFEELSKSAAARIRSLGGDNIEIRNADVLRSTLPKAHFDAVVVGASVARVPALLADCLVEGGRMFVVRGRSPAMEALCLTARGGGRWSEESLFETDLPRLIGAEDEAVFEF